MPRKRIYTILLLAMTVGAIFAFSTYQYVRATPAAATPKTTPVVVANSSLDLGAALRAEDLRTINWPSDDRPVGTFSNPQELVGRGLIQPARALGPEVRHSQRAPPSPDCLLSDPEPEQERCHTLGAYGPG